MRPGGDFSEGRVSVRLQVSDASVIQTRAGDNVSEEAIENVTLLVYKKTGTENVPASWTLQDKAYQQLIDDNDVVSLYLTADEVHHQRVYAICNLADTSVVAWDKVCTNGRGFENTKYHDRKAGRGLYGQICYVWVL